ncbi:MAG: alanine racemase, partial [Blastocatellia bacterium]
MEEPQGFERDRDERASSYSSPSPLSTNPSRKARPTWAEVNLDNLIHNFGVVKAMVGPGVGIMPAVKAEGYGHGAIECARVLETAGADWFG